MSFTATVMWSAMATASPTCRAPRSRRGARTLASRPAVPRVIIPSTRLPAAVSGPRSPCEQRGRRRRDAANFCARPRRRCGFRRRGRCTSPALATFLKGKDAAGKWSCTRARTEDEDEKLPSSCRSTGRCATKIAQLNSAIDNFSVEADRGLARRSRDSTGTSRTMAAAAAARTRAGDDAGSGSPICTHNGAGVTRSRPRGLSSRSVLFFNEGPEETKVTIIVLVNERALAERLRPRARSAPTARRLGPRLAARPRDPAARRRGDPSSSRTRLSAFLGLFGRTAPLCHYSCEMRNDAARMYIQFFSTEGNASVPSGIRRELSHPSPPSRAAAFSRALLAVCARAPWPRTSTSWKSPDRAAARVEPDRRARFDLIFAQRHRGRVHVAWRGGVLDAAAAFSRSSMWRARDSCKPASARHRAASRVRIDVLVRARVEDVGGGRKNAAAVDELGELGDEVVVRGVALELEV